MKYIRNALVAALILMAALSCAALAVGSYTAYTNRETYVYRRASTASEKVALAMNTKVLVTGSSGSFYKVRNSGSAATGYILKTCLSQTKTTAKGASWRSRVVKLDWFKGGSSVLKRGSYGYLYDIDTGISLRIKRMGGSNHADVEPATAADTAKLLRIAGGKFSWKSHAVILYAGGKYVACGINTKPHGDQTIRNNNYNGQFCLHMVNSRTHGSDSLNANHQASINRAYNWAH